jgi:hypothetical protein
VEKYQKRPFRKERHSQTFMVPKNHTIQHEEGVS